MFMIIGAVCATGCILVVLSRLISPKPVALQGSHVLVTGGSSGIGKAVAIEAVKRGANVTLLARNLSKLTEAQKEIECYITNPDHQKVVCSSIDITKDYGAVQKAVNDACEKLGPPIVLYNCAGTAVCTTFEDSSMEDFQYMVDLNYLGTVRVTKATLPHMKQNSAGRIVFVSSQAGLVGIYGYTAYAPSKFALRGFAETLQMEVKPHNIYITVAYPPDTDTPGFEIENLHKPEATHLISGTSGLWQPDTVAKQIVIDSINGKYTSSVGQDAFMLVNLTCGMSPVTTVIDLCVQVFLMGVFRLISLFYLVSFDRIVRKCAAKKQSKLHQS